MDTECPSDEVLAAHVGGALAADESDRLGVHLDSCDSCRALVIALARGTPGDHRTETAATQVAVRLARASANAPVELPPRYRVDRLLGQGGMGRVFAAHDTELDRPVAVKLLRPELGGAGLTDRLLRESRLMARISDPAVVTVYDVGRHGDHVFVAMEYIAGATLSGWLERERRPWRAILDVFRRAGQGLVAAHAAGLVHRDVKPENILLALDGDRVKRVAVSDFGVARAVLDAPDDSGPVRAAEIALTATGAAIGTPAYMAPEQLDAASVDHRADVFGFGVALWEALYGERPYRGVTPAAIRDAMRAGAPAVPSGPAPRWLGRAIRGAIEPDVERRTPSLDALLVAIDPRRHDRRVALAISGVALFAIAVGGFALWPRTPAEQLPAACRDAGLADVWTAPAREATRAALTKLPGEAVGAIADRAIAAGDAWVGRWNDVRANVCRGDEREPLRRPAGAACLETRRRAFAALVQLVPTMKPADLVELDEVFAGQPSAAVCETDTAKLLIRDAKDPARAAALQAQIAEIATEVSAGDRVGARAKLAALEPAITAAQSSSLTADFLFASWRAIKDEQPEKEIDLLRTAAIAADKAGRSDLAAICWLQLADVYSQSKNDSARANEALGLADSAIARGGEDPSLRAHFELVRAHVLTFDGKLDDAQRALDDVAARAPRDAPQLLTDIEEARISLLRDRGKLDDALAVARRALAERTARLGPSHRSTATAHSLIADILIGKGDIDGTLAETRQVVELANAGYGPNSDWYGLALRNESVALSAAGKLDDALADARKAREVLIATRGAKSFMVGNTYETEATAYAEADRYRDAVPLFQQAMAIYDTAIGDNHLQTAECALSLGSALGKLGRGGEAIDAVRKAVDIFKADYGDDNPHYAYALAALGALYVNLERKADARPPLESAVAIFDKSDFDPEVVWTAKFNLAQAIIDVPGQRARSLELARGAKQFFASSGRDDPAVLAGISKWLAHYGR